MSKELGPREQKLREQREARFAARAKPNPFEDAARGSDPAPTSAPVPSDGSVRQGPPSGDGQTGAAVRLPKGPATATNSKRPSHKIIEGLKEAIAVVKGEAQPAKVTIVKVGRPKRTEAQPWEALGISKASYYRRQAKAAKGEME